MTVLLSFLLFAQAPIDFADHLYSTGDFTRAALEYERIAFLSLADTSLASYALLKSGEALLKINSARRAASLYEFGMHTLPHDRARFGYGLLRAEFSQHHFSRVIDLACLLEGTDLEYNSTVYRSFALAFSGDGASAARHFSLLDASGLRDSSVAVINTPLKHRSLLFSAGLSTVFPGAGQAYCGRWGDAWQSFSITALLGGAGVYYLFFSPDTSTSNTVKGTVTASLGGIFWLGNVYGAANAALDYNNYQERKREEQLRNLLNQFDLEPEIKRP